MSIGKTIRNLPSVFTIPEKVTNGVFTYKVTSIGDRAFNSCINLECIQIPNTMISIGNNAFGSCYNLTQIAIPARVSSIGSFAFSACTNLTGIYFQGNAPALLSVPFNKTPSTIYYKKGTTGWINPWGNRPTEMWNPQDIIFIYQTKRIHLPNTGQSVYFYVSVLSEYDCTYQWYKDGIPIEKATDARYTIANITEADVGDYSVIVSNQFTRLESNPIPLVIGRNGDPDEDFRYTITNNTISITRYIGTNSTVHIPDFITNLLVTSIGQYTFLFFPALISITIPDTVTEIGIDGFRKCNNLTHIEVDKANNNFSSLGGALFNKDQTKLVLYPIGKGGNYEVPDSVITIGNNAFAWNTNLTSVVIGKNVTTIEDDAFKNCSSITSAVIPDRVTTIGDSVFRNCSSLTSVYFKGNAPTVDDYAFRYSSPTIYYVEGTTGWGETFGGRPTAVWVPEPEAPTIEVSTPVVTEDGNVTFELTYQGTLQWSTDMKTWQNVEGATGGTYQVKPSQEGGLKFYRFVQ